MAQLRLGYPEIKRRGAEVFQITPTPPKLGPIYARRFALPFSYLCDGDSAVHRRYGLTTKGMLAAIKTMVESFPGALAGIISGQQPSMLPYMTSKEFADVTMEQALFLVGRDGRVRFRHIADVHAHIPSNESLLRALDALP